ncbi:MAG: hypothetical protein PHW29_04355, partial [Flavobacterium sp.]|nr:hypothetical protein [Flavobacterium sp.]
NVQPIEVKNEASRLQSHLNRTEADVERVLKELIKNNYTEITNENIMEWRSILGDETYGKVLELGATKMLPEYMDLLNLHSKMRAMMISHLVVYADLMKTITLSNDQHIDRLSKKYKDDLERQASNLTTSFQKNITGQAEQFNKEAQTILEELKKEGVALRKVVRDGENARNGIENSQKEATEKFTETLDEYLNSNFPKIAKKIASIYEEKLDQRIGEKIKVAKTKYITIGSCLAIALLFAGNYLGKFIH